MIARPSKSIWIWDVQAGSVYICRVAQDRCAEVERRLVQCAHIHLHNQVSWRPKRGCHTGALTEQKDPDHPHHHHHHQCCYQCTRICHQRCTIRMHQHQSSPESMSVWHLHLLQGLPDKVTANINGFQGNITVQPWTLTASANIRIFQSWWVWKY